MPPILVIGGILGLLKLIPVGPMELPRQHPYNQRLSIGVLITGVGLLLLTVSSAVISTLGIILSVIGTGLYIMALYSARKDFPRKSYNESLRSALSKYSFWNPRDDNSKQKTQKKK